MKLLLMGIEDPRDIRSWSGIPYHLSQSLKKSHDLCYAGRIIGLWASLHRQTEIVYSKLQWGNYRVRSEPNVLKEFARRADEVVRKEKPDVVVSMSCEPIAFLKPGPPVIMIHDSTFRLLSGSYPYFQALSSRSQKTGEEMQQRGFDRATALLPASRWAQSSACQDYGVPTAKTNVLPLGANMMDPPGMDDVTEAIDMRLRSKKIEFLFVGVDWVRKGGDSAVKLVGNLVEMGIDACLHVVGCNVPAATAARPFVVRHGFLSKNKPADAAKMRSLFKRARFFIMPSIAECFGCVFCEAFAFGLPCVARDIGGIPDIITNGGTGFLISPQFSEEQIADRVRELVTNPEEYRGMALRARADYEARLNWDVYTRCVGEIIAGCTGSRQALAVHPRPEDRSI